MDRLMVADTIPTKFVILFSTLLLFSCQNKIFLTEYELIDGLEIPRYVRINEFSGTITIMYIDDVTMKSKKKYKNGPKWEQKNPNKPRKKPADLTRPSAVFFLFF